MNEQQFTSAADGVFSHRQRVRFPDVDHAGVAFFGALIEYCHDAHEEWLAMLGYPLERLIEDSTRGMPIVHVEADFLSPAKHGDRLRVDVSLVSIGDSSLTLAYDLRNETVGTQIGVVEISQVFVNLDEMSSTPFPSNLRNAILTWAEGRA